MASLWRSNGDLQKYIERHPGVDRYLLVRGHAGAYTLYNYVHTSDKRRCLSSRNWNGRSVSGL